MTNLNITSAFDGGNIIVHDTKNPSQIRLAIRPDNASDFFQWFYYRLTGAKDTACRMVIENAKDAAFKGGWEGYRACASYDRETWFRVDTTFENGELIIAHTPELDSVYYVFSWNEKDETTVYESYKGDKKLNSGNVNVRADYYANCGDYICLSELNILKFYKRDKSFYQSNICS